MKSFVDFRFICEKLNKTHDEDSQSKLWNYFIANSENTKVRDLILDGEIENIKSELDNARKLKEEANSLVAEYERKVQSADEEANNIINQAKEIAKNHEETSKAKAEEFIKRAEQQAIDKISRAEKVAISKVNEEIVANSVNIAEKIIIENINEQSSKKLVEQSISQINKLKT